MDKLDKVGVDGVIREFEERGLPQSAAAQLPEPVALRTTRTPWLPSTRWPPCWKHASGESALASVRDLARAVNTGVNLDALRDPLLARGLDYYTGAMEVTVDGAPVGAFAAGDVTTIGRASLVGKHERRGISFGADRIEDILNHFDAWPAMASDGLDAMCSNGARRAAQGVAWTRALKAGLSAELYPDPAKLKKHQVRQRPERTLGARAGERIGIGQVMVKDMQEGAQEAMTVEEAVQKIQSL